MTQNKADYNKRVQLLEALDIAQKQELSRIIERHMQERQLLQNHIMGSLELGFSKRTVGPNSKHKERRRQPLAIGHIVKLLTTVSVGNNGDLAKINSFGQRFIKITKFKVF